MLFKLFSISRFIGANGPPERTFSLVKNMWTEPKSNLGITELKAMVMTKYNCTQSCIDFYNAIKTNKEVLQAITSNQKYVKGSASDFSSDILFKKALLK